MFYDPLSGEFNVISSPRYFAYLFDSHGEV